MWWKSPCHDISTYRATTRACHDVQPEKLFQNMLWETNFICAEMPCPRNVAHVVQGCANSPIYWYKCRTGTWVPTRVLAEQSHTAHEHLHVWPVHFSPWLQTSPQCCHLKHQRTQKRVTGTKEKKTSMFLMSFSLVYCSFCKSSLRIASCQISSPKIHAGASNAPRTHFNITGSNRVRKC